MLPDLWQVRADVERAMAFMGQGSVDKLRDRLKTGKVESTRRFIERKVTHRSDKLWRDSFQKEKDPSEQEGTPRPDAAKIGRSQWDDQAYTNQQVMSPRPTTSWRLMSSPSQSP